VIAILGGLGAAISWAITALTGARASREIGSASTLAWVMLTGLLVVGPVALAQGKPEALDGGALVWLAIAGTGNIVGLLFVYTAMRIGKVGLVSPITSSEGAVAALIAVAAGEHLGVWTGVALGIVAVGVVLAARPPAEHRTRRGTTGAPPRSRSRPRSPSGLRCTPPAAQASSCRSRGLCCRPACSAWCSSRSRSHCSAGYT
jgi:drug/metabolite transporter (DMT)-like permease